MEKQENILSSMPIGKLLLCFRIFLGGILLCCVQKASSIFLQSVGKSVKATVLSVSRDVVFLVPLVVWFSLQFGIVGMLWAAPCADLLAFILTVVFILSEFRAMGRRAHNKAEQEYISEEQNG